MKVLTIIFAGILSLATVTSAMAYPESFRHMQVNTVSIHTSTHQANTLDSAQLR